MKKEWIATFIVLSLIALFLILVVLRSSNPLNYLPDDDPAKGFLDAKITIVEFADYQDKNSASVEPTLRLILKGYRDRIRFIYRDFPLPDNEFAKKAAESAECADEQGKFWQMHDKLFKESPNLDIDNLKKYATELKLDGIKFDDCLDSGRYALEVEKDFDDGLKLGITGVPTFFINKKMIRGNKPIEEFKEIIEDELS